MVAVALTIYAVIGSAVAVAVAFQTEGENAQFGINAAAALTWPFFLLVCIFTIMVKAVRA